VLRGSFWDGAVQLRSTPYSVSEDEMLAVEADGVCQGYRGVTAVDGLSLKAESGELVERCPGPTVPARAQPSRCSRGTGHRAPTFGSLRVLGLNLYTSYSHPQPNRQPPCAGPQPFASPRLPKTSHRDRGGASTHRL